MDPDLPDEVVDQIRKRNARCIEVWESNWSATEVFALLRFPVVPTMAGAMHCSVQAGEIETVARTVGHPLTPELLLQIRIMETAALGVLNTRR